MKTKINKINATDEKISSRGGLSLFLRYVENIKLYELINSVVILKIVFSNKGLNLQQFLKQMFAYFIDGTDMSISGFDKKKTDKGYISVLENIENEMASDSGFADQKAFDYFDTINVHFVTTSKIYEDVREYAELLPAEQYNELGKGKAIWKYFEFASKRGTLKRFRRSIFTTLSCDENGQYVIGLGNKRTDNLIFTNIGTNLVADKRLKEAGGEEYFKAENIIILSHQRGADELIHRSIKELATKEQLPFKRMGMNRAYYFLMVITHFIFETYKRDVTNEVIPVNSYPNTFRRKIIDFATKITSSAGYVILNVPRTIFDNFKINDLWKKCQSPPIIQFG